jgi:hypothetical protein
LSTAMEPVGMKLRNKRILVYSTTDLAFRTWNTQRRQSLEASRRQVRSVNTAAALTSLPPGIVPTGSIRSTSAMRKMMCDTPLSVPLQELRRN